MRVSFLLLGLMLLLIPIAPTEAELPRGSEGSSSGMELVSYSHLPLSFELNQGQTDPQVKFLARGAGYTLFLASDEAVLTLQPSPASAGKEEKPAVVRLRLVGAERNAPVVGEQELAGRSNYFVGNDPRRWRTQIPTYAQVRYRNLYPGIDLVYYGRQGQLEYDFVVAPGAEARAIGLEVVGAEGAAHRPLRTDTNGDLVIATEAGEVRFHRPQAYQDEEGLRRPVEARYRIRSKGEVGIEVADYDPRRPLIIDPVLSYSTYLGGSGGDVAYGIAVDSSGDIYITGVTGSRDFPLTSSAQSANQGAGDAFVVKLNPPGTGLVYSTYLGGSGQETGTGIAVDSTGNVYIAGFTYSTNFPVTTGAFQPTYAGDGDGFIARLSAAGSTLTYASYIGGSDPDFAQAVAVDSSGNAYLTGSTRSSDFPVVNFLQIGNVGASDVFVTKVSSSGTSLIYSTYLGGSDADFGRAIVVDQSGNVYVSGYTYSSDFPTQNAFQSSSAGGADAFVTELDATGSALLFSTYLGGRGQDRALSMTVDATGSTYITGDTYSTNFPTTSNALQAYNQGQGDVFVSKLNPGGWGFVYSTFLGGSEIDQGTAVAVDSFGNAYVTGFTRSDNFPTSNPIQKILGIFGASSCGESTCTDAFAVKLRSSGQLVYSTYLGGSGSESGWAIAVDSLGRAYLGGETASANFPIVTGTLQSEFVGSLSISNAFVAKIADDDLSGLALSPQEVNFGNQTVDEVSDPREVTLINAGSASLSISGISTTSDFAQTNNCGATVPASSGTCRLRVTFTPTTPGTQTGQITITDSANGSPHHITVTGTGVLSSIGDLTVTPSSLNFPSETINETSPAQVVYILNTGRASITLSDIDITGDFKETNTCGGFPSALNAGDGCSVSIVFTPTSTGERTGTLSITSDAAGGPQTVSLVGIGNAVFAISINSRSTVIQIGEASDTKPTYTVSASASSSFTDSISLACSASCTFDPSTIKAGETSTLTVSDLSPTSSNPLNIAVTGTSGGQTSTVWLTIFFSDFELDASPGLRTINAGQSASYTITVTPSNTFTGVVLLSCSNLPQEAECSWSPSAVWVNGSEVTARLTIETTSQEEESKLSPPTRPKFWSGQDPLALLWAAWLVLAPALFAVFALFRRNRNRTGLACLQRSLRLAALGTALIVVAFGFACGSSYTGLSITSAATGTPSGNYVIAIQGTLGNNNSVTRATTINLSVGPG
jgi:Beta-propeller repeat/HYDIN/CFA65/VesB-like, Ig-like domain